MITNTNYGDCELTQSPYVDLKTLGQNFSSIDHIMTYDIWDSEHFCNAYWNITLHLQPWED